MRRSYDYLKEIGQPVRSFRFYFWYNSIGFNFHLIKSAITGNDFDALCLLKKSGTRCGIRLSDDQWKHVHSMWYAPLREIGEIESDLCQTLDKLSAMDLKLGILSNTFVNSSALKAHLAEAGVDGRFDVELYSYEYDFRKPDKRIFLEAARQARIEPEKIVYVGDLVDKDVLGSMSVGMTPVLKNAHSNDGKKVPAGVQRIDKIAQLPALIEKMKS